MLVDPAEADEASDRLVHPLARCADHPGEFFLGDRQHELVGTLGQLEQSFRGTPRDIEDHAVGECFVHYSQALCEQAVAWQRQNGADPTRQVLLQVHVLRRLQKFDDARRVGEALLAAPPAAADQAALGELRVLLQQ